MSTTGLLRIASTVKHSTTALDLAIVERAAIARKEIVDRCTILEVAFRSFPVSLVRLVRAKPLAECSGCYALSQKRRTPGSGASGALLLFGPISGHSAARRIRRTEASCLRLAGADRTPLRQRSEEEAFVGGRYWWA